MERMNILVSTNDAYVMPLTVLLESLFENNAEPITLYFLHADITEENRRFIEEFAQRHDAPMVFVPVGEAEFAGLPTKQYISRETYFRLLAAEYLPADVSRILWLDADMVVNGSIAEFYRTDFEGAAVIACPHGSAMRAVIDEDCQTLGIAHPEQYFNAGVMLCNLDVWRTMDIPQRIAQIAATPRIMQFPGQDFTNLVFNGRVKTADWRHFNCMIHSVEPSEVPALAQSAEIIHYVGSAKPWQFSDIPFADVWMEYYRRSPFGSTPLRRTSYARMKAMWERAQKLRERNE